MKEKKIYNRKSKGINIFIPFDRMYNRNRIISHNWR